jgi:hypothetical protein
LCYNLVIENKNKNMLIRSFQKSLFNRGMRRDFVWEVGGGADAVAAAAESDVEAPKETMTREEHADNLNKIADGYSRYLELSDDDKANLAKIGDEGVFTWDFKAGVQLFKAPFDEIGKALGADSRKYKALTARMAANFYKLFYHDFPEETKFTLNLNNGDFEITERDNISPFKVERFMFKPFSEMAEDIENVKLDPDLNPRKRLGVEYDRMVNHREVGSRPEGGRARTDRGSDDVSPRVVEENEEPDGTDGTGGQAQSSRDRSEGDAGEPVAPVELVQEEEAAAQQQEEDLEEAAAQQQEEDPEEEPEEEPGEGDEEADEAEERRIEQAVAQGAGIPDLLQQGPTTVVPEMQEYLTQRYTAEFKNLFYKKWQKVYDRFEYGATSTMARDEKTLIEFVGELREVFDKPDWELKIGFLDLDELQFKKLPLPGTRAGMAGTEQYISFYAVPGGPNDKELGLGVLWHEDNEGSGFKARTVDDWFSLESEDSSNDFIAPVGNASVKNIFSERVKDLPLTEFAEGRLGGDNIDLSEKRGSDGNLETLNYKEAIEGTPKVRLQRNIQALFRKEWCEQERWSAQENDYEQAIEFVDSFKEELAKLENGKDENMLNKALQGLKFEDLFIPGDARGRERSENINFYFRPARGQMGISFLWGKSDDAMRRWEDKPNWVSLTNDDTARTA